MSAISTEISPLNAGMDREGVEAKDRCRLMNRTLVIRHCFARFRFMAKHKSTPTAHPEFRTNLHSLPFGTRHADTERAS
jgi:hypothetical protein